MRFDRGRMPAMKMMKRYSFIALQYLIPQHLISRLVGQFASCTKVWIKRPFIHWFIKTYQVDMSEAAESDPDQYAHFNDFFTRALRKDVRPIATGKSVMVSPVDGRIYQAGNIEAGQMLQAKGIYYSVADLLAVDADTAKPFEQGSFSCIYLSPKDYHRIHMPFAGKLTRAVYVPGRLFSVNPTTTESISNLFAINERLVCWFDTQQGPMVVVFVGAMIVAAIEVIWQGRVVPRSLRKVTELKVPDDLSLKAGDELGRFLLGSTAIVLTAKPVAWDEGRRQGLIQLGQRLGQFK